MIDMRRTCTRYGAVLVEFVDHGEVGLETAAALRHLDGCQRCTEAVESTLLTITALRRLADDIQLAEPPADAWPRLRARLAGLRRRPIFMSPLAGAAMSIAIVAVLVLPFHVGVDQFVSSPQPTGVPDSASRTAERLVEAAYRASSRRVANSVPDVADIASIPVNIPPEIWQVRKEVHSAKPSRRPPEAI